MIFILALFGAAFLSMTVCVICGSILTLMGIGFNVAEIIIDGRTGWFVDGEVIGHVWLICGVVSICLYPVFFLMIIFGLFGPF